MIIQRFDDYESMSRHTAELVLLEIDKNKDALICAATGNSPIGLYEQLVNKSKDDRGFFINIRLIGLDEWGGVPINHPITCEYFLRNRLIDPVGIPEERITLMSSNSSHPIRECDRVQTELDKQGPIDICVLGFGKNGHLGFNEPGPFLEPHTHRTDLSIESMQHSMIKSSDVQPSYGLTLGMKDILASKLIVILITGTQKSLVVEDFLEGKITPKIPATFLWLHENVHCMIDENVFI